MPYFFAGFLFTLALLIALDNKQWEKKWQGNPVCR